MIIKREKWEDALISRHGAENHKCFSDATVAICGLGGLGSNIAILLARTGIGKLVLVDFDKVDITNIHRQQYKFSQIGESKVKALSDNIKEINPYIKLETHQVKVTIDNISLLVQDANIVCEAFDEAETKAMFANYILKIFPKKYLISASGMADFTDANTIQTKKITEHFYVCGDGVTAVNENIGLVSTRVTICAAHQAHKVLQILLKEGNIK